MKSLSLAIWVLVTGSFNVFAQTSAAQEFPLDFQRMPLAEVLKIYAELSQRTVLRADLPAAFITLKATVTNREQAVKLVTQALEKEHLALIMDGEKFVLVVRDSSVAQAKAVLAKNPMPAEKPSTTKSQSHPESGTIVMPNCSISNALSIYKEIAGAAGLEPNPAFPLPPSNLSMRTQTALGKKEVIHAFDILFGLNGFKMVPVAGNKLKVVPF